MHKRTPVKSRNGIKISAETREAYEKARRERLDTDPDSHPLPPERWANAMRREEFFRPKNRTDATSSSQEENHDA